MDNFFDKKNDLVDTAKNTISDATNQTAAAVNNAVDTTKAVTGDVYDKTREAIYSATEQAIASTRQAVDATKQVATDAYDKTSRTLNDNYQKAAEFGRANPGKATLIALGAGVGLGLLLAARYSTRSRNS